ncbi:MAG: 50S ribosomal protein L9 [Alphaproteobacteria bacterium MarineAlpha5_Bin5]|nr:MAG: 50S ribosomal protein L9 [Alphaproteobacteria bacterium MarineAlpha5_Bin5]|tara:strand:+ start:313 stop:756 length:444 start_codon:yes stop_codon:yes gene_type:complete
MKVILTTNIKKLGKIGDLVNVKEGFARNFLFPKKMALRENNKNLEYYEKIKEEIKEKENLKLENAKKIINQIKSLKISFNKEADEKDQLYGSISKKEIINYLKEKEIKLHSDDIIINEPIRSLGEHNILINPYVDISETIKIIVNKN